MALVVLSWPQHAQEYVRQSGKIEIRWRSVEVDSWAGPTEADGDATEKQFDIRARKGQRFIFQARARNGVGSVGPWVTTYMDAGSVAKPVNVASLTATIIYGAVLIRYAGVTSPFHAYTEFREGVDWDTGTPLGGAGQPTRSTGSYFVWPWPTYGSHTIWAKHFDSTGQESVTERSVTVTVDDRIKLGSVGIDVNLAGINLCPNSSFEIDRDSSGVADGWNAYQAGTTGTVARTVPSLGRVRGKCQQITASALGTADTDRVGVWRDITVSPGAIQKAIASVYVWGTFGRQGVVVVEARQGSTVLDSKTASITTSGSWKRIAASFTAFPADCDTVRVYLWMSSGAGSAVTFRVDDVVFEEADVPSAWHPSPWDELLGTDGIADGAATIVVDSYSPGPDNYTGTSTVHLVQASTITNDDTVARQVIVTGQLTLTFPNGIAAANEIYAWLGKTTDANFGSSVYADWRHVVAAGEDKNYSITITSTRTIPAGATETYWIGVWISNFTSPARYYAERVRAELVKR